MKNMTIVNKLTCAVSRAGLQLKKYSPEILVVSGIIGVVASTVMACKATTKVGAVIEEAKADIDDIHADLEIGVEDYTQKDANKELASVYAHTGLELVKLYGPAVVVGAVSITSILASNGILRKRNVALAAAYTAVDKGFKEYRGRVVERFGKELDRELRYNIKAKEVESVVVDENGNETVVKEVINVAEPDEHSEYVRCFDCGCTGWTKDPEFNLMFLRQQQNYANDLLKAQGYLFLNDVYKMLGIPVSKAGAVVGWIYDKNNEGFGDNFVDFGIYNISDPSCRDFVNGRERSIWLDFNVAGVILDML